MHIIIILLLIHLIRYSLSGEVIEYIHKKGCIMFCMRNIQKAIDQPPLDVVESIATIFSCLKDSADISQVQCILYVYMYTCSIIKRAM